MSIDHAEFKSRVESLMPELRAQLDLTPGVSAELAPALLSAAATYLASHALAPVLVVDYDRRVIPIPDDCDGPDLARFGWACLCRHARRCVHLAYAAEEAGTDVLVVLFFTRATFFKATASVRQDGKLGEWKIERHDAAGPRGVAR